MDRRIIGQPCGLSASKLGMGGMVVGLLLAVLLTMSVPAAQAHSRGGKSDTGTIAHHGVTEADVVSMIEEIFGPYAPSAIKIARCESGLDPSAYNPVAVLGSHAMGVFQILYPSTWMTTPQAASSPYEARSNILAAHAIFMRDGDSWREWECQA